MLPALWKPVEADGLIRLGAQNDGGYVVSRKAVEASTLLVSMGLNDDWRFEAAFRKISGARIICFDHTVNYKFWILHAIKHAAKLKLTSLFAYFAYRGFFGQNGVEHRLIRVGYDVPGGSSLAALLAEVPDDHIFLKVDIEGSEYRILDDIVAGRDRITGIVMEFHDIDYHRERIDALVRGLPDFDIVFLHGNNWGGVDAAGDPLVLEIALMRKSLLDPAQGGGTRLEITPNNPDAPDIDLHFEPLAA